MSISNDVLIRARKEWEEQLTAYNKSEHTRLEHANHHRASAFINSRLLSMFKMHGIKLSHKRSFELAHKIADTNTRALYLAAISTILGGLSVSVSAEPETKGALGQSGLASYTPESLIKTFLDNLLAIKDARKAIEFIEISSGLAQVRAEEPGFWEVNLDLHELFTFIRKTQPDIDKNLIERFIIKWRKLASKGKIMVAAQFMKEIERYTFAFLDYIGLNELAQLIGGISTRRSQFSPFYYKSFY